MKHVSELVRGVSLGVSPVVLWACRPLDSGNGQARARREEAKQEIRRLAIAPVRLPRPVLVINGYRAPGMLASWVARDLRYLTSGDAGGFEAVSYQWSGEFRRATDRVLARVAARWPHALRKGAGEIDVVGISMGGLVARWAALEHDERRRIAALAGDESLLPTSRGRLRIARLFTLCTPHRGAKLAERVCPDAAARNMRPGSAFIEELNRGFAPAYELVCYAHTNDLFVGATRTSPPGVDPIWTPGTRLFSHFAARANPVFIADVARRLRGEAPLVRPAGAPTED